MRHVYTLLWLVALPLMPLRLWWRGRREPGYRTFVAERFGVYRSPAEPSQTGLVWIHAVSLGETRAAAPLIERLRREMPDQRILLTHMTATGREAGRALYGTAVVQAWLPYDVPFAVRGFLAHFRPRAGLLVETELWPNVVAESSRAGVALFLVNARLSERSARGYARITSLSAPMFRALKGTAAQSDTDARRLAGAGAIRVAVTGNLKFDVAVPAAERQRGRELRAQFGAARPVLLLASTRDGEEALLLDAYVRSRDILPKSLLLVVVPRHPQRFDAVAALLAARQVPFSRRSGGDVDANVQVVLGDSVGELFAYYTAADVAFVAGSLLPLGGQNLIESLAAGVPTLIGPHTFNFQQASDAAVAAGAARRARDADDVFTTASMLLADARERAAMRERATAFMTLHAGAADRLWTWLAPRLSTADRTPPP